MLMVRNLNIKIGQKVIEMIEEHSFYWQVVAVINISKQNVCKLMKKRRVSQSVADSNQSRRSKVTTEHRSLIRLSMSNKQLISITLCTSM